MKKGETTRADAQFVLYQADKDGNIVTVASMARDPIVAKSNELLRTGRMPKLDEIKKGKVSFGVGRSWY